jgi:hypothetical protein
MFCLGLVVLREHFIRTTIRIVFIHIFVLPPTLIASLLSCVVSCDVWVMCRVVLFCVVPRPSDTRIAVLGFVTHSMFGRSFKAALYLYISCVREKENLRFDFLNHSTGLLRSNQLRRRRTLQSPCLTS